MKETIRVVARRPIGASSIFVEPVSAAGITASHIYKIGHSTRRTVVIVHGLWGSSDMLGPLGFSQAELGYNVYCLDLRGRLGSRSVKSIGRATIGDFVDDVRGFIRALNRPVVVMGWSMGALVGAKASKGNRSVEACISIASAPHFGVFSEARVVRRMSSYVLGMIEGKAFLPSYEDVRNLIGNGLDEGYLRALYAKFIPDSAWAALQTSFHLGNHVGILDCPSLVIGFDDDRICGNRPAQAKIARKMGSDLIMCHGCHLAPVTDRGARLISSLTHNWLND